VSNEVTSLEHDIEETRERLANTIDELLYRAHPKTIVSREVASLKAHFVDPQTGSPRTDNILKIAGGVIGAVALFVLVRRVAS
jgi:LPXTG-motif cell wall-anchored protein